MRILCKGIIVCVLWWDFLFTEVYAAVPLVSDGEIDPRDQLGLYMSLFQHDSKLTVGRI